MQKKIPQIVYRVITIVVIIVNWVIFRADSILHAGRYIGDMFGLTSTFWDADAVLYFESSKILLFIACIGCIPWYKWLIAKYPKLEAMGSIVKSIVIMVLLLVAIMSVVNGEYSAFIYFNF